MGLVGKLHSVFIRKFLRSACTKQVLKRNTHNRLWSCGFHFDNSSSRLSRKGDPEKLVKRFRSQLNREKLHSSRVWNEDDVVKQVKQFANHDFAWNILAKDNSSLNSLKKSAVLVPLFIKDGDISVWLTLRADRLRKNAGDVAFPGGKRDASETEADTCLREALEEIGLLPRQVRLVGIVPPQIVRPNILVTPYIGVVSPDFRPEINLDEVQMAFSLPMKRFLEKRGQTSSTQIIDGRTFRFPVFEDNVEGKNIVTHGLTAWICVDISMGMYEMDPEFGRLLVSQEDQFKIDAKNPFIYQVKYLESLQSKLKL